MRNSERRRRALVRSCACIRLESAMRTAIVHGTAAEDGLMKQAPNETELSCVLMVGVRGGVLKGTCHIIRTPLSNRETEGDAVESRRARGRLGEGHGRIS